jgi:Tfp pilus assembly protein PilF
MEARRSVPRCTRPVLSIGLCTLLGCAGLRSGAAGLTGHASSPPEPVVRAGTPSGGPVTTEAPQITADTRWHVEIAMGQMLESSGNLGEAQAHYEQALKLNPKCLDAMLALGRVYTRAGRPDAALKMYDRAEKAHRKNPSVYNDKGLCLAEQHDWPGALAALRQATKLDPASSKYHNNLGTVLAASGQYDAAWSEFREAVGPAVAHYNVAVLLASADRIAEAQDHLERAMAAMPHLAQAESLLAQLRTATPVLDPHIEPVAPATQVAVRLDAVVSDVPPADDSTTPAAVRCAASIAPPTPLEPADEAAPELIPEIELR